MRFSVFGPFAALILAVLAVALGVNPALGVCDGIVGAYMLWLASDR